MSILTGYYRVLYYAVGCVAGGIPKCEAQSQASKKQGETLPTASNEMGKYLPRKFNQRQWGYRNSKSNLL